MVGTDKMWLPPDGVPVMICSMIGHLRTLTLDDLRDCLALAQDRDWPRDEHKWRLLFEVGTVYGLSDAAGDLVGTTILTRYGTDLAAISMVLVAARHNGQGLGRRLMTHALAEARDDTVFLNATENGRPLYEKLGFITVGTTYTHFGHFAPDGAPARSRPAEPGDLPAIAALDAQVNGADRTHVVNRLPDFTERLRVVERRGVISGYAGAWRSDDSVVIGPVIAETADDAKALIADLAGSIDGPVRLDLDDRAPQLREWANDHGVPFRSATAVMVHGGRLLPGDRTRWFLPVMQALG